ncbi:MAG: hypothetical protein GVY16_09830 [Planctomycetes bacterium]|nr:hypothetical protein [Planctomycetota bacterium]
MLEADLRRGRVRIDADRLGGWTMQFSRGMERVTRGFSVNVPAGESDLRRIDSERLAESFDGSFRIVALRRRTGGAARPSRGATGSPGDASLTLPSKVRWPEKQILSVTQTKTLRHQNGGEGCCPGVLREPSSFGSAGGSGQRERLCKSFLQAAGR